MAAIAAAAGAREVADTGRAAPAAPAAPAAADERPPVPFYANHFDKLPSVTALAALGRALFFDPALSASGRTACATCHSPSHAFGPPNGRAVQRGGADGRRPGVRAVPSLRYLQSVPPFTEHAVDDEGNDGIDQGPAGGLTWDGRAQSAHDQARIPLLSPFEMANTDSGSVVKKLAHSPEAARFRDTFGDGVFEDQALAFQALLLALETYQQDAGEFYPYSSKYDAFLRQQAVLTPDEARGLEVFSDPAKGNCDRCHPSAMRHGAFPAFSDFGYAGLGAPRNPAIAANAGRWFDLGLCGPLRTDLTDHPEYCGLFRTPTLRNVAMRRVFLHNGVFHRLRDVVRFYAERDSRPGSWYPRGSDGATRKFDDVPEAFRGNLDQSPPFGRRPGDPPALTDDDVEAIVAFLGTLTDGYRRTMSAGRH
jgi:cytochrome c peroxidase